METFTQAYHAGALLAQLHNLLPDEKVPTIVECMVHFNALRQLFGERLWQKLKTRNRFSSRIRRYEALNYQGYLPKDIIGTPQDFMYGYIKVYENSNMRKKLNEKRSYLK